MLSQLRLISNYLKPSSVQSICLKRFNSRNTSQEPIITVTNDGTTIVCWHEEQPFPYQHSRPIPKPNETLKEEESVLKIQHRIDGQNIHKGLGPNMEEIQMLTYTPKHLWNRRKVKRVIPLPKHPRPGL